MRDDLNALADRCECEGPSAALDVEIDRLTRVPAVATFPIDQGKRGSYWLEERGGDVVHAGPITSSLDAAVAFVERVLGGWDWRAGPRHAEIISPAYSVEEHGKPRLRHDRFFVPLAATPALALVAAALRALAARDGGGA